MEACVYCSEKVEENTQLYLTCEECNRKVHVSCLKTGPLPGDLLGDVFFKFTCHPCSPLEREEIHRQKMPWITVIILALYNLHNRSEGLSRQGYFHWKMHICNFIERHWNILFRSIVRKRSWFGTVSGTLSHYSPIFFRSGSEELKESGWWQLSVIRPPALLMQKHIQAGLDKRKSRPSTSESQQFLKVREFARMVEASGSGCSSQESSPMPLSPVTAGRSGQVAPEESSLSAFDDTSSVELNNIESERETVTSCSSGRVSAVDTTSGYYSNWGSLKASDNMYSRAYVEPSETLSDCLFADEDDECSDVDVDIEGVENTTDICCPSSQGFHDLGDLLQASDSTDQNEVFTADIKTEHLDTVEVVIKEEKIDDEASDNDAEREVDMSDLSSCKRTNVPASLFEIKKTWPPDDDDDDDCKENAADGRCLPMSEYEELQLLNQLRKVPSMNDAPAAVRRLYRKLTVRRLKRERGLPLFDIDLPNYRRYGRGHIYRSGCGAADERILDRFQRVPPNSCQALGNSQSFIIRLMGQSEPTCFYSPYTQRLLKPFIRRDMETRPLWLRLLEEIQVKGKGRIPDWQPHVRHPIDYSYVRIQHIPSINSLCREFFYPGIDLTECLQYPDFSCVVLYRKLVIGFAFMVPDVGLNEAYISFLFTRPEWRRAGIATFMLYHLIQTCMGKDVTLHVSATNPAIILYQKFGFKVEEFVQDFYDKYLPADSKECKHALFLRLSR